MAENTNCRLIADGGSTKVHWQLQCDNVVIREFVTTGLNPVVMSQQALYEALLSVHHLYLTNVELNCVEYFGAGCIGAGAVLMADTLSSVTGLPHECITVASDMLGAARALLGNEPGIACILGTGANSCLYDGGKIVSSTPALGYILGDEGSGAWIGKRLLSDCFKGVMPSPLAREFVDKYNLSVEAAIEAVYHPASDTLAPNRFLASLTPFANENIGHKYMREIVKEGFHLFVSRNLTPYMSPDNLVKAGVSDSRNLNVCFTGGIAFAFRDLLEKVLEAHHFKTGVITRSPLSFGSHLPS